MQPSSNFLTPGRPPGISVGVDLEPPLLRGVDGAPLLSREALDASVDRLASMLARHDAGVGAFGLGEADATLALLPWTHGHGLLGVVGSTAASGGSLLLGARGDARAAVGAIADGRVTWISVVPPLLALLVEAARGRPVRG